MKIELIRNVNNNIVGYKMIKESDDDTMTIEIIRDMYFWGVDDRVIVYDGRKSNDQDDTIELRFVQKGHKSSQQ